ncbi:leucine-rich repeat extensin-like protein 6 [Curcuma longa]|uniref:leucine-rich repeat extensin-like protein 6 n=1 Tax=Curcuma longa TaxID=136217 RepID=UPI003D9EEFA7
MITLVIGLRNMMITNLPRPYLFLFLLFFVSLPLVSHSQFLNFRLAKAFTAMQALKRAITSDPNGLTSNWSGPNVCNYTGVFCAAAPDEDPHHAALTVAGVDLNHGDLEGTLPDEIGLLSDLALFHLNSNRFHGALPLSLGSLRRLFELDLSNNRFDGGFPMVVLDLPSLRFLDLRFNRFCGDVPSCLFDRKLDALFLNNNHFTFSIPDNIGHSPASVIVLANNQISGCLPAGLGDMGDTLRELVILNAGIRACVPPEIGRLRRLRVLDLSYNHLIGPLPATIGAMAELEQLDVAHNKLSGAIPSGICDLPRLKNFTYAYNFFTGEPPHCLRIRSHDDRKNCIPFRRDQRPLVECATFLSKPRFCHDGCIAPQPPPHPWQ